MKSLGLSLVLFFFAPVFAEADSLGILVLAHGGPPEWNAQVEEAVRKAQLAYPTEIAFGMGMSRQEVNNIQQAIWRLEAKGVKEIFALPLLVSSYSSVYRQYEYLLGSRGSPSWTEEPVSPIEKRVPIYLGKGLGTSSWVAEILLERALALSQNPAKEAVVLVAHGPEEERDDQLWLKDMRILGEKLKREGNFSVLLCATLRDDAQPKVRERATRLLRLQVERLLRSHRVIVVPLLISQNGIEEKIRVRLSGLAVVYTGQTLLPHPNISSWIKEQVMASTSEA